ncbi:MAG: ribonuclease HII [archaeon]
MGMIIGIDDAGRGPVIGPMVLAGVLMDKKDEGILKNWGARDSKLLTPKKRKEIKEKVKRQFVSFVLVSSPLEIDESSNLNHLEAIKTAMIINELVKDLDEVVDVFVDCPSVNIKSWSEDVQELVKEPSKVNLSCEHKADLNHLVVSAASILAKERREDEINVLKKMLDVDFGSGYPSDSKTVSFIKENFDNLVYKEIIRHSWNTVKRLVKAKKSGQKKLF